MKRRSTGWMGAAMVWARLATLPAVCAPSESAGSRSGRPNLLFIMSDDQGYWDTGAAGNPHIDTPNMNSLAADGIQFRRYYAAPVCAPTRAGLMTGRYYLRTGLYNTRFGGDSLGLGEVTVAELLKKAGYRTGLFGKWHLGQYPGYQPQDRGFDEFLGHYHGHIERYEFPDQIYHNGVRVDARGYVTDLFTDAAMDFIDATSVNRDTPFFCALMYNAPHSPFLLDTSHSNQPKGDTLLAKYLSRGLPLREARIYAMVERIDMNLGRILQRLDDLGLAESTLIVYTSDNGGVSRFWTGGMNGQKATVYEGGVRAPCYVRWRGTIPAGRTIDAQVSHVDWFPTFCELAGVNPPADRSLDGKSMIRLLKLGAGDRHHEYVYHTWDRHMPNPDRRWSVSDQRWKLLGQIGSDSPPSPKQWRLFDLENDPGESANLAEQHPEIVRRLRGEFDRWFRDVTTGQTYVPIRIPVGHPKENPVELQPSWATWEGPNVTYTFDGYDWDTLDGWSTPGDKATWRLNVIQSGRYAIRLSYGCSPLAAGGVLRVSVGTVSVDHVVQPTATAEQFGVFEAGELLLDVGEGDLTAEVVTTPRGELMRLNAIRLERMP